MATLITAVTLAGLCADVGFCDEPLRLITVGGRETADAWRNLAGGRIVGDTVLSKLELSGRLDGAALGWNGFRAHAQVFRVDGGSLSDKVGDAQTVSNIEAPNSFRLFEAWAEQAWGQDGGGGGSVRAGLIDLNSEFDSIDPGSVFINSSHGIGPDLSRSGVAGPPIFPVTSLGVRASWSPTKRMVLRAAAFDGVPGDPSHPAAFAAVRLDGQDGALLIAEGNYNLTDKVTAAVGVWRYTTRLPDLDASGGLSDDRGIYAFVEGPLGPARGWSGWLRAGIGNGQAQLIGNYVGMGAVKSDPFGLKGDQAGVALGRAGLGDLSRRTASLAPAETTIELTWQHRWSRNLAVQPDLQYVIHPSGRRDLGDALVVGLRVVLTSAYPFDAELSGPAEPNTPPDAPDRR